MEEQTGQREVAKAAIKTAAMRPTNQLDAMVAETFSKLDAARTQKVHLEAWREVEEQRINDASKKVTDELRASIANLEQQLTNLRLGLLKAEDLRVEALDKLEGTFRVELAAQVKMIAGLNTLVGNLGAIDN